MPTSTREDTLELGGESEPEYWDGKIWDDAEEEGGDRPADHESEPEFWDGKTWNTEEDEEDDWPADQESEPEFGDGGLWNVEDVSDWNRDTADIGEGVENYRPEEGQPTAVPIDIGVIVREGHRYLSRLPLGLVSFRNSTAARFLGPVEQTFADGVFSGSVDFSQVLITDGLGGHGHAFTIHVPSPAGDFVVMNIGPEPFGAPLSDRRLLVHELAYAWQSQHHPSSPSAFMTNSALSQVRAVADKPFAKAAAAARATAAVRRGVFDPKRLASISEAAAAAEDTSAYAYVPHRRFGDYAAAQIAKQIEHSFAGVGSPTPAVIKHIRSLAPHVPSRLDETSLATSRWERKSTPGVVF